MTKIRVTGLAISGIPGFLTPGKDYYGIKSIWEVNPITLHLLLFLAMQTMHEKVQNDNEDSWDCHLTMHTKYQMLLFAKFQSFFEENATL